MNLTKCKNGHYYDADMFEECPHCNAVGSGRMKTTEALSEEDVTSTVDFTEEDTDGLQNAVGNAMSNNKPLMDERRTVGFFDRSLGKDPVVGWLVAISGAHIGEDFRVTSGRNFVGRDMSMDVCLSKDGSVSRNKHAVLLYEPKQNIYLVQPGESKELSYVNDEVVISAMTIKRNDILLVGDTKLMFIPCCDDAFSWKEQTQA